MREIVEALRAWGRTSWGQRALAWRAPGAEKERDDENTER
jgi:hypothetical protein